MPEYSSSANPMSLANGIFIRDTYFDFVKKDYTDLLTSKYDAEVIKDNFANANNVNNWISEKTLGIIKNMLKS